MVLELTEGLEQTIREGITQSRAILLENLAWQRARIHSLYTGRGDDYLRRYGGFVHKDENVGLEALRQSAFQFSSPPDVSAALLFATISSLTGTLYPTVPSLEAEPITGGAYQHARAQTKVWTKVFGESNFKSTLWQAIRTALFDRYCGFFCRAESGGDLKDRFSFETVDPWACGWETFYQRYRWRSHQAQFSDLSTGQKKTLEKKARDPIRPWDIVSVVDVYIDDYGQLKKKKLSFVDLISDIGQKGRYDPTTTRFVLGELAEFEDFSGPNPLMFLSMAPAAPREAAPVSGVNHWLAPLDTLTMIWDKISESASELNDYILVDTRYVSKSDFTITEAHSRTKRIIGVYEKKEPESGLGEGDRGVQQMARPMEYQPILPDLVNAWILAKKIWDDLTGTEIIAGQFPEKVHPATTAGLTARGADNRNRPRRENIIDLMKEVGEFVGFHQRRVLGPKIEIRVAGDGDNSVVRDLVVPDWNELRFSMRVTPADLGNAKRSEDPQALQMDMTNAMQAMQAGIPGAAPWFIDSARRLRDSLGIPDSESVIPDAPVQDDPLRELYISMTKGRPYQARQGQDHAAAIGILGREVAAEEARGAQADRGFILYVRNAMASHEGLLLASLPTGRAAPAAPTPAQTQL